MRIRDARHRSDESGVTLIEIVLAITISGLVLFPMTGALILYFRTVQGTSDRFAGSHDARLLSTYLPPDVQSATSVVVGDSVCSGRTNLVRFGWSNAAEGGTASNLVAAYSIRAEGPEWALERAHCSNGAVTERKVVAHRLAGPTSGSMVQDGWRVTLSLTTPATETTPSYTYAVTALRRQP